MTDIGKDIRSALITARHVAHSAESAMPEGRAAGGGIEQVLPLIAGAAPAIGNALQSKANGFAEGGEVDKALAVTAPRQQLNPQGLYSHAAAQAQALSQAKGSGQQMLASLKGVKPEELANSGAAQKFAGQPSVTRDELASHFRRSLPKIQETRLSESDADDEENEDNERPGAPNFEEYTIPGGENYRELLLHTPAAPRDHAKQQALNAAWIRASRELDSYLRANGTAGAQNDPEYARINAEYRKAHDEYTRGQLAPSENNFYHRPHWGNIPNVVAHLRLTDRNVPTGKTPESDDDIIDSTAPSSPERRARFAAQEQAKKGEKILHMEELQSDWGQQGREKGFREDKPYFRYRNRASGNTSPDFETQEALEKHTKAYPESLRAQLRLEHGVTPGDPNQPPKGPYVGNTNGWTDLGLKRALREAALGKYDRLAWTPGQEQAERYGLEKHVKSVHYDPNGGHFTAVLHNGKRGISESGVTPEGLEKYAGKDVAQKLLAQPRAERFGADVHSLEGQDLRIGAHKMKKYYDEMVPGRLKEILKKLGHETKFEPLTIKHPKDDAGRTEHTLHSLHIPPDLREKILKGMPAYASGGAIAKNTEQPATIPAQQNPNFQKWFAGSKVVNGQGQPDTLYHGTAGDFDVFKHRRSDIGMHFGTIGQANDRLSYQRDMGAKTEAGMNLMPVHLAIRNPLRMDDLGSWDGNGLAWALAREFPEQAKWISLNVRTPKQARDFLQSKGRDGIVYKNTGEVGGSEPYREAIKTARQEMDRHFPKNKNSFDRTDQMHPAYQAWSSAQDKYREHRENNAEDSYIAFHPTQVKSATGNSGNFDPKDPSVVRAGGGPVTLRAAGGKVGPYLWPAVRHAGKVYRGATHVDALEQVPEEHRQRATLDGGNRGWVNDRGRFLNRERAQQYAVSNGLIREDAPSWAHTAPEAISENLKPPPEGRAKGGKVTMRAAGVVLRDPEDRILFVKRNPKGGDHGGEWAFPGGKIERGETPAAAAARETHEELGHRITSRLGEPVHERISKTGVHYTTFEHRVPKQFTPKLNDEHSGYRWAHPNSAPSPLHPGAKATLEKLARKSTSAYAAGGGIANEGPEYDTREDGPFYRVARRGLEGVPGGAGEVRAGARQEPADDGRGGRPLLGGTPQPDTSRQQALQGIANAHAAAHGRGPVVDEGNLPASLHKQSAIGAAFGLAALFNKTPVQPAEDPVQKALRMTAPPSGQP